MEPKCTLHGSNASISLSSMTRWWVSIRGGSSSGKARRGGGALMSLSLSVRQPCTKTWDKCLKSSLERGILWTTVASCFTVQACPSSLQRLCYKNMDIPWPAANGEFEVLCTFVFDPLHVHTHTHILCFSGCLLDRKSEFKTANYHVTSIH